MIHFPLVILPLLYGTQVDNFTSVNPWIKRGYPHLLFMGCPEHLNVKSDHIRAQGLTPTGTQVRTASSLSSPDRLKWGVSGHSSFPQLSQGPGPDTTSKT